MSIGTSSSYPLLNINQTAVSSSSAVSAVDQYKMPHIYKTFEFDSSN